MSTTQDNQEDKKKRLTKADLQQAGKLFSYILPFKWAFIGGMLMLVLGSLLFLGIMMIPGEMINTISNQSDFPFTLNQLFYILLIGLGLQAVMSYFRINFFAIVSEKSMALLRKDLYQKLLGLSIPFFEQRRVGELTSRITNDVTQVQGVVSLTIAEFLRQIIILLGGIFIIIFTMPRLALVMLITFPVVIIVAMFFGRYIRKLVKERQDKLAETNIVVEETMQNVSTVKAYTNEWYELGRYSTRLNETVQVALRAARMRGAFAGFIVFVMFGALFFIMWRAAIMVQDGLMPQGDLVSFVVFTGIIGAAIASLGNFYADIISAVGATDRIMDILKLDSEVPVHETQNPAAPRMSGRIRYQDVAFNYPTRPDVEVLKGINMDIAPGEQVALVGSSGAGKSTIMQLLLGFYPLDSGEISIDGQALPDYPITDLRQNMAIVPQEVLLFGGTIRENIEYGRPGASDAEIIEAAKQANAWSFINNFPEGLDTVVGERGIKLSGGQRQRVAIARAILKDPAILLLDEATSSLDAESEKLVQEALNTLMQGRTSIIIAHRLATIREVDRIYVLDDGKIIEQGTHDELTLRPDGAYNALAQLQFDSV